VLSSAPPMAASQPHPDQTGKPYLEPRLDEILVAEAVGIKASLLSRPYNEAPGGQGASEFQDTGSAKFRIWFRPSRLSFRGTSPARPARHHRAVASGSNHEATADQRLSFPALAAQPAHYHLWLCLLLSPLVISQGTNAGTHVQLDWIAPSGCKSFPLLISRIFRCE
jgi:hypothetical protein